jgi:hypothetical protein
MIPKFKPKEWVTILNTTRESIFVEEKQIHSIDVKYNPDGKVQILYWFVEKTEKYECFEEKFIFDSREDLNLPYYPVDEVVYEDPENESV